MQLMKRIRAPLATVFAVVFWWLPAGISYATECLPLPPPKPIQHVCGIIINQLGEPIPNAKVAVLKDGQELVALRTDKDGKFSFEQLEAGSYQIQVHGDGYLDAYFPVVVVKPTTKCRRVLQVGLAVGMGCSGMSVVKPKKIK